jgi:DNA-binding beta-propeller fold protein YncE
MVMLGDLICRRFYSFVSLPHRLAAAFLSGLLISTWFTYLAALLFARSSKPLLWGNLLFFAAAFGFILWLRQRSSKEHSPQAVSSLATKADRWDWIIIGLFLVFVGWQMFSTFSMSDGKVQIANHQWSDFGSTVSIMQSFALGHNFPTEYPHFSGDRIRYHFLFYFQAGNLEYLGLNPALSNNILSILSLVSMLVLVMTLGVVLFRSRAVGRIGAALFFFHGSLSFIPFLISQGSIGNALNAALTARDFLPSGFPYRGELWGVWSQVVFINQRHLATSVGLLLLVLIFLITRYRAALLLDEASHIRENNQLHDESEANDGAEPEDSKSGLLNGGLKTTAPFIFSGVLLGLLPMFNSAIFMGAFAVLGFLFVLFPLKKQMLWLAATTAVVALPQVIFLKTGNMRDAGYSLFHWGYTVENPTLISVVHYLGFIFGFKWLLIALALFLATKFQRRVMIAISSLIALAFFFQFSDEVLANHKFLNLWLIVANLFVAYSLWRLWNMTWLKSALPGKIAAVAFIPLLTIGGIIDLFPIRNGYWVEMPFEDDALIRWVREETDPKAIFLSHRFVNHRILLAGRPLFYGHPYFAWSAGYPTTERDITYKKMFEERNPQKLLRLLRANKISYVAIDDGIRKGDFIKNPNEAVFKSNFERVFQDIENRYDGLIIFKVPANLSDVPASLLEMSTNADADTNVPPVSAFKGGQGRERGQFEKPRGIAADAAGNLYVADWGNSRIQKFSPEGEFLNTFGKSGVREGELREPNGITIDSAGKIYVADALNHRLIRFNTDGSFEKEWSGPAPGFYGPRDVAIGPNKQLYVLDQGRSRVVRLEPESENFAEWGQKGMGEGEFNDPTGLAVGGDRVFVTDAGNNRIQVFDLDGKFIRQWDVPEWDKYLWHYPDTAFDTNDKRLYVTSGWTNEVLVFDADGNRLDSLKSVEEPAKLDNPSSLVLADAKSRKRLYVLNTGGARVSVFELGKVKLQK